MKPISPNNFARFKTLYPEHGMEITQIEKAISDIEDEGLRNKIEARINVELGVVLLQNQEVGDLLSKLFQKELKSGKSV
jgi:hypothetical protein